MTTKSFGESFTRSFNKSVTRGFKEGATTRESMKRLGAKLSAGEKQAAKASDRMMAQAKEGVAEGGMFLSGMKFDSYGNPQPIMKTQAEHQLEQRKLQNLELSTAAKLTEIKAKSQQRSRDRAKDVTGTTRDLLRQAKNMGLDITKTSEREKLFNLNAKFGQFNSLNDAQTKLVYDNFMSSKFQDNDTDDFMARIEDRIGNN